MLVYNKANEKSEVIDFREAAPGGANPNLFHGNPDNGIRGETSFLLLISNAI